MRVEIRFVRGSLAGHALPLDDNATIVIGRGEDTTLRIQDPSLSRRHCQIVNSPRGPMIADLGSANGTLVNGQRIAQWTPLVPGSRIVLGSSELELALPAVAPGPSTGPGGLRPPRSPGPAPQPALAPASFPSAPPRVPGFPQAPLSPADGQAAQPGATRRQQQPLAPPVRGVPGASPFPGGSASRVPPEPPGPGTVPVLAAAPVPQAPHCSNCNRDLTPQELQSGRFRQDTNGRIVCAACLAQFDFDPNMVEGYSIEKKLGQGAFGAVFKALQARTGQLVALKTIKPALVSNEKDIQRFFREAETGSKLVHPGIARIYDAGNSNGTYFIAMEYIEGQELAKLIEQYTKLDVGYTLRIGLQMSNALQHAFEQGIVHRDIKPENILVSAAGVAKLVDFGLAKNFQEAGKSGLTAPGEGMGTLAYMPPEQLDNALMADQRSDIYSLGATLYHCLAGRRPFNEKTTRQFILKILNQMPVSLREANPAVPPEVQKIIERAMAKKPEERYQTPRELEADLKAIFDKLAAEFAAMQTQQRPGR